jgi:hypothetical protein
MRRPTADKFVYNLTSLPSTFAQDSKQDIKIFHQKYISLVRRHKRWLRRETDPHHLSPCTNYPITSGELAIIQLRK